MPPPTGLMDFIGFANYKDVAPTVLSFGDIGLRLKPGAASVRDREKPTCDGGPQALSLPIFAVISTKSHETAPR